MLYSVHIIVADKLNIFLTRLITLIVKIIFFKLSLQNLIKIILKYKYYSRLLICKYENNKSSYFTL